MPRELKWLALWDAFRHYIESNPQTSWGKIQIMTLMDKMERDMVREAEKDA